jgi:hypothetical protein
VTKPSTWIEEARVTLRESALNRIDFKAAPSTLFQSIQRSFMYMGIFIDAEKEEFLKEIETLVKRLQDGQDDKTRIMIKKRVIEFLKEKIR